MSIAFTKKTEKEIRNYYKIIVKHEIVRSSNDKNPIIINKNTDEVIVALSEFMKFFKITNATQQKDMVYRIFEFVDAHYPARLHRSGELKSRENTLLYWKNGIHFLEFIYNEPKLFTGDINKAPAVAGLLQALKKKLPKIKKELAAYQSVKSKNGSVTSSLSQYVFKITNDLIMKGFKQEPILLALDEMLSIIFISGLRDKGGYESILRLYKKGKKIKKHHHLP